MNYFSKENFPTLNEGFTTSEKITNDMNNSFLSDKEKREFEIASQRAPIEYLSTNIPASDTSLTGFNKDAVAMEHLNDPNYRRQPTSQNLLTTNLILDTNNRI